MLRMEERQKVYAEMQKTPLRITMELETPLVYPSRPIHLDAILTRVVSDELFPGKIDRQPQEYIEIPLPLEKTQGQKPVWKASCAYRLGKSMRMMDFWVRRPFNDYEPYRAQKVVWSAGIFGDKPVPAPGTYIILEPATGPYVDVASGGFKAFYESREIITVTKLIFHAVGNRQEVERLLSRVSSIGKKRSIGFAKVKSVIVEEIEEDFSLFDKNGRPARYLPMVDFPEDIRARVEPAPPRPPYWSVEDLSLCWAPPESLPEWPEEEEEKTSAFLHDDLYQLLEEEDGEVMDDDDIDDEYDD